MANVRFVPLSESQAYLEQHYGLRPYTERHFRHLIKLGKVPKPVQVSPSRKAHLTTQLDAYAQGFLAQAEASVDAAD